MATLVVVPSAQAQTVTTSNVASPKDGTYLVYNEDAPNTISIAGTSSGTTGNHVDLVCYAGDKTGILASDVPVGSNGSFSVSAAGLKPALLFRTCNLKAVPAGTTPVTLAPFTGPRLYVGDATKSHVSGGPNNGKLYDFYLYFQQPDGGMDYDSLGGCGIDDGYLLDSTDSLTTVPWYCNAWLANNDLGSNATRSEIQVDGADAYPPSGAKEINAGATSGFPTVSSFSYSQNSKTGNSTIHEKEAFVKCENQTYPPTSVTCPSFTSTGVTDTRTIVQDHGGRVAWVTDVFKSTNGKAHKVDLLWQNDQHFFGPAGGNAGEVEYKFPGQSGYSMHQVGDVVSLPGKPGTIRVRYHGAADGDPTHGRGAIVYDHAATAAKFMYLSPSQSDFTLHQSIKIPANGSVTLRFAYVADFHQAKVDSLARQAAVVFKGCTVPKVIGKSLAAAKKAIRSAHCAVGKITRAQSTTIPAGRVVFERPKAKTHVDYGTKVSLVVSKG
ncbi:MAG TPA: PASTA domain-containing protein [Gaiellaceae bacterium]|nr:PASTA domain-containing protein [Gaiellaceae bacterium]